jgi:hypothetical protein
MSGFTSTSLLNFAQDKGVFFLLLLPAGDIPEGVLAAQAESESVSVCIERTGRVGRGGLEERLSTYRSQGTREGALAKVQ